MQIWNLQYPRHTVPILKRKRTEDLLNFLAGLAICGPGTTTEVAKFVMHKEENSSKFHYSPTHAREKEGVFFNIIRDRPKANSDEKYVGLESRGFVKKGYKINEKNKRVPFYLLTLKGCFFALGFEFDENDMCKFIENAARNHLYFAYLNILIHKTSFSFVKEMFISPFQKLIKDGRIILNGSVNFYFPNMMYVTIMMFQDKLNKATMQWHIADPGGLKDLEWEDFEGSKEIIAVIKNMPPLQEIIVEEESVIRYLYPTKDAYDFYMKYSNKRLSEISLLSIILEIQKMYNAITYGI